MAIKIPVGAGNLPACPRCPPVPSQLVHFAERALNWPAPPRGGRAGALFPLRALRDASTGAPHEGLDI